MIAVLKSKSKHIDSTGCIIVDKAIYFFDSEIEDDGDNYRIVPIYEGVPASLYSKDEWELA